MESCEQEACAGLYSATCELRGPPWQYPRGIRPPVEPSQPLTSTPKEAPAKPPHPTGRFSGLTVLDCRVARKHLLRQDDSLRQQRGASVAVGGGNISPQGHGSKQDPMDGSSLASDVVAAHVTLWCLGL